MYGGTDRRTSYNSQPCGLVLPAAYQVWLQSPWPAPFEVVWVLYDSSAARAQLKLRDHQIGYVPAMSSHGSRIQDTDARPMYRSHIACCQITQFDLAGKTVQQGHLGLPPLRANGQELVQVHFAVRIAIDLGKRPPSSNPTIGHFFVINQPVTV